MFGHGKLMLLHVSNDIIVSKGITGSSGGDLSNTEAQSILTWAELNSTDYSFILVHVMFVRALQIHRDEQLIG